MNYIGCFNRSRAANCLQPVFFRSWCASMLPGVEYCRRAICAVPGVSMLPGVECYPCTFAPFLVCLDAARCGRIAAVPLCAVPGASMLPGVEYCRRAICAFLVCLDAARRGVLSVAPFCAVLVPRCCQVWSVARCTVAPFLVRLNGAHFVTLYIL